MRIGLSARPFVLFALSICLAATVLAAPVDAAVAPSLKLFVANTELTVERNGRGFVSLDPGVWVTPVGGDFELWLRRADYDTPFSFVQVDSGSGAVLRTLPLSMAAGTNGLSDFAGYEIRDGRGDLVARQTTDYCPNSFFHQRLSDESPLNPHYPYDCNNAYSAGAFLKGAVWGIDEGWASGLVGSGYYGGSVRFRAPRKHYTLSFAIDPVWTSQLEVAPGDETAEIDVTVVDRGELDHADATARAEVPESLDRPSAPVPDVTNPDPSTLPDLVALPAYRMNTQARKGRDYLNFFSTEWNEGPGTFVIEGFRGQDEGSMDAFQYFLDGNGVATGRAGIGELEFHRGGGHNHWHFEEFTRYSLLDASKTQVLVSGKQSWCLVNTDAIDLTVPNARWLAYGQDLGTSCGTPGALWIREVLDVGWGDTYAQFLGGQGFNITNLPNGTYYVRVHVNPTGSILESDVANNIEDRLIKLKGRPGHRRVVVPPWHGIDTEGGGCFC
ncbi:MAG TPA: lysyl oxidase family protein [Actinomycetota bacterium]|jgi:Lysyl oxidase|nr:lysyl oxidase family protein [Actinomycetota bacterium]